PAALFFCPQPVQAQVSFGGLDKYRCNGCQRRATEGNNQPSQPSVPSAAETAEKAKAAEAEKAAATAELKRVTEEKRLKAEAEQRAYDAEQRRIAEAKRLKAEADQRAFDLDKQQMLHQLKGFSDSGDSGAPLSFKGGAEPGEAIAFKPVTAPEPLSYTNAYTDANTVDL